MKLSIIIPVYNEEQTIIEILKKIENVRHIKKQIIIIDDKSDDNSFALINSFNFESENKIIKHNSKKIQYSYFNNTLCFRKLPLQFLIRISPLRGPKTFPIQKLSPSILVKVTQSIQSFSQTTFLIRKS